MAPDQSFNGFPREGIQFLRDLAANNEKTWFDAHKQTYIDAVQQPAVALVAALGQQVAGAFPPLSYDTRANGSGSLMRIHRDVRFSADKTPYKTNIAMMFTAPGTKRMATPGFGLQISAEKVELIGGQFGFDKTQLETYRDAVTDDATGAALVAAWDQLQAAGDYGLNDPALKRVPRGYDADHPRAEWLKYKGLYAFAPPMSIETAYSAALVEQTMAHFHNMAPIYHWLVAAIGVAD